MNLESVYVPRIYKCKATKSRFSTDYLDSLQDRKRLNALKNHYRASNMQSLPLTYGHVLIMLETLKKRFLNTEEKGLLRSLIDSANIDYLSLCYKKPKRKVRGKYEQLDMLAHLYTYTFPCIDYRDLDFLNTPSNRRRLTVRL